MNPRVSIFAVVLVALVGCGGPVMYVEVEEPRVCKNLGELTFPGAPPGVTELRQTFPEFDFSSFNLPTITQGGELDAETRLIEVSLNAGEGILDFNNWETAALSIIPASGSTLETREVVTYQKDPAALPGRTMAITAEENVNLLPYLTESGNVISVDAVMTGVFPEADWTAEIKGCLYMRARYNYATQAGL
jgi:hypothetical protein